MVKDVVTIVYLDTLIFWIRASLDRLPNNDVLKEMEKNIKKLREEMEEV